ncbi:MAG: DUF58 domain-containing protein [Candidatus Aureabacteria bacterium]|nr:DUF58 domain-containing protein [Candidatus Auribacterota bacterium]
MPQTKTQRRQGFLKPEEIIKIKDLSLVARGIVEGLVAGHHKSPYKGFSLEFAEHRKYTHGDEIKHLDWKVYGRTEKYFVKLYEAETNMRVYLLLDTSESMNFSGGFGLTKLTYGTYLCAALAYLINKQQDQVGLVTYNNKITRILPPRHHPDHMARMINNLSSIQAEGKTHTSAVLQDLAERIQKRSLLILISDLLDDPETVLRSVGQFRFRKHEIMVFHVLDNAEWIFPYKQMSTFVDMETHQKITVDPIALRMDYLRAIEKFKIHYQAGFSKMNTDYIPVNTLVPFEYVLSSYLAKRKKIR